MTTTHRDAVESIIDGASDLTLATNRPDGYPQATTISYAHDGLTLYAGIGRHSQKASNIRADPRVSLTINLPYRDWREIRGLSMAAEAHILDDAAQIARAQTCLLARFPQVEQWSATDMAANIVFVQIVPRVISVLDYTQGFGHTDLLGAEQVLAA
jgi:general stress protein 26